MLRLLLTKSPIVDETGCAMVILLPWCDFPLPDVTFCIAAVPWGWCDFSRLMWLSVEHVSLTLVASGNHPSCDSMLGSTLQHVQPCQIYRIGFETTDGLKTNFHALRPLLFMGWACQRIRFKLYRSWVEDQLFMAFSFLAQVVSVQLLPALCTSWLCGGRCWSWHLTSAWNTLRLEPTFDWLFGDWVTKKTWKSRRISPTMVVSLIGIDMDRLYSSGGTGKT